MTFDTTCAVGTEASQRHTFCHTPPFTAPIISVVHSFRAVLLFLHAREARISKHNLFQNCMSQESLQVSYKVQRGYVKTFIAA